MKFISEAADAGARLDQFLAAKLESASRSQIQHAIKRGEARVNGEPRLPSHRLHEGDAVELDALPDSAPGPLKPLDLPIKIAYEDDDLLIVDKPAGLVVHPAPGHEEDTLVNMLLSRYGPSLADVGEERRCGIVHRLDKLTSGLLVVAKNSETHAALTAELAERNIQRRYIGLAIGHFDPAEGTIDKPIGRRPNARKLMGIVPDGRPAQTSYRALLQSQGIALLLLRLHTGRTHQIRVHLQAIGRPILGDEAYGWTKQRTLAYVDPALRARLGPVFPDRQLLHAAGLRLQKPGTDQWIECLSPPPEDMAGVIALLYGDAAQIAMREIEADLARQEPPVEPQSH